MVLSNFCAIEHRIKRGDFVNLHRGHFKYFGDFVHRRKRKEVVVLFLGDKQCWDDGRRFVVVGVLLKQSLDSVKASLRKLKWS